MKIFTYAVKFFLAAFILLFSSTIKAQETTIIVRAHAQDAKFIGTSMGGIQIIIRDAETREILSKGITEGSTGNTEKIMEQPRTRNKQLSEEGTAKFTAKLNLEKPVFATIEAYGPLNSRQSAIKASTQLWLLPGKDITGDGIVIKIPGFVVDIISPQTHESIAAEKDVEIEANVVLMCGCPITDGGMWDANQYEIKAIISNEGDSVEEVPLKLTDKASTFKGVVNLSPGVYEIMVYAFDPVTGNSGVNKTNIIVK